MYVCTSMMYVLCISLIGINVTKNNSRHCCSIYTAKNNVYVLYIISKYYMPLNI